MPVKFYVDTSIWRDYFEDRKDSIRPLGEFAFQFLKKCREKKASLLYSDALLFELKNFPKQWAKEMFFSFKECLAKVAYSQEQIDEARKIGKERQVPFNDAFHAIIARDNNAVLITRDKHFLGLKDIVESAAPEEAIFD